MSAIGWGELTSRDLVAAYLSGIWALLDAKTVEDVRLIRRTYTGKHGILTRAIQANAEAIKRDRLKS